MDPQMEPDRDEFRGVMSSVCTPVAVVTSLRAGRPHGTTVSAFASLSLDPPMVLVALDRSSQLLAEIRSTGRLAVNVLGSAQHELAARFARKDADKFVGVGWDEVDSVPRLRGVAGFLSCAVDEFVDGGDHIVLLAAVRHAIDEPADPLTYHRRAFGTYAALTA